MKDFYDVWELSELFAFDAAELQASVALCFQRRRTSLVDLPEALSQAFYLKNLGQVPPNARNCPITILLL